MTRVMIDTKRVMTPSQADVSYFRWVLRCNYLQPQSEIDNLGNKARAVDMTKETKVKTTVHAP